MSAKSGARDRWTATTVSRCMPAAGGGDAVRIAQHSSGSTRDIQRSNLNGGGSTKSQTASDDNRRRV